MKIVTSPSEFERICARAYAAQHNCLVNEERGQIMPERQLEAWTIYSQKYPEQAHAFRAAVAAVLGGDEPDPNQKEWELL
jgi:hypothetical protein